MNYEEKYKEALERAKKELNTCGSQDCDAARQIFRLFPELAESEDERIKEDLIQWINEFPDTIWRGHYKKDVIDWLKSLRPQSHWRPTDEQMEILL